MLACNALNAAYERGIDVITSGFVMRLTSPPVVSIADGELNAALDSRLSARSETDV